MKKMLLMLLIFTIALTSCSANSSNKDLCEQNNGTWLEEYSECEYLSKEICESNGGTFNECASSCRHLSDDVICTMQCVPVCSFK